MATKKTAAPVRQQDINLASKARKDAATLAKLVAQDGKAALPFLDDVIARGSPVLRREAVVQMATLDPKRAERTVRAAFRAAASPTSRAAAREREERLRWFLLVGTPSAVQTFLDEGGEITGDPGEPTGVVLAHAARRVPSLDASEVESLLVQIGLDGQGDTRWTAGSSEARALARALLDHAAPTLQERGVRLLCQVDGAGALPTLRELGRTLPLDRVLTLCRGASPAVQFDELSGYVVAGTERASVLAALTGKLDRRWLPLLEPLLDDPAVSLRLAQHGHPAALARLRAVAARDVFDSLTQRACYQLGLAGDREATPHLLRWLADPTGRQASPLLLTALGACAGPDAIPVIERLAVHEPGRANFYDHTIATIRQRGA